MVSPKPAFFTWYYPAGLGHCVRLFLVLCLSALRLALSLTLSVCRTASVILTHWSHRVNFKMYQFSRECLLGNCVEVTLNPQVSLGETSLCPLLVSPSQLRASPPLQTNGCILWVSLPFVSWWIYSSVFFQGFPAALDGRATVLLCAWPMSSISASH